MYDIIYYISYVIYYNVLQIDQAPQNCSLEGDDQ